MCCVDNDEILGVHAMKVSITKRILTMLAHIRVDTRHVQEYKSASLCMKESKWSQIPSRNLPDFFSALSDVEEDVSGSGGGSADETVAAAAAVDAAAEEEVKV